jgi:hypothetical protein
VASPALIYSVAVYIDSAVASEWVAWMRTVHIPDVLATRCFRACRLGRTLEPPTEDREAFILEYEAVSSEGLREYRARHAEALQRAHRERYAGRFEASRSVWEVLGTLTAT